MKVNFRISKSGTPLYAALHEISDAESFGLACADAWAALHRQQLATESSVGSLMEHLSDSIVDRLNGAHISLERA